jgi:hypothetical protein
MVDWMVDWMVVKMVVVMVAMLDEEMVYSLVSELELE